VAYEFLVGTDTVVQKVRYKDAGSGASGEFVPGKQDLTGSASRQPASDQIESSLAGRETVKVQAGSFTADHYRYSSRNGYAGDSWMSNTVPGHLVRFVSTDSKNNDKSSGELVQIESDVATQLNSY
jgi:hypothetical protein